VRSYGKLFELLAGAIAIGAGVYLLTVQSAASDSIFNPLLHALGAYFGARGIWMLRQAGKADDMVDRLNRLVEFGGLNHVAQTTRNRLDTSSD
jgi:hypothetical protein